MVEYRSIWSIEDIFCDACGKSRKGIRIQNKRMIEYSTFLSICNSCLEGISSKIKEQ